MSHDSATGYLKHNQGLNGATNLYAKNQIGTVYQQLDDGARALDVRPKLLSNGTLVCHHGAVTINVLLESLVRDAIAWCNDNPDELVLILHHNFAHPTTGASDSPTADTAVAALSSLYSRLGVKYVQCGALFGLTVTETMVLASLRGSDTSGRGGNGGGYLLALDQHDAYTTSCAKLNYVQDLIVTCYPPPTSNNYNSNADDGITSMVLPCTNPRSQQHAALKAYVTASSNNDPSDSSTVLGPPSSTDKYPFFEIQALWQVDARSAAAGVAHVSSLIDDNTRSRINSQVVDGSKMETPLIPSLCWPSIRFG